MDILINTTSSNDTTTMLGPNNISLKGSKSVTVIPTVNDVTLDADNITIDRVIFDFASNVIKVGNGDATVYGTMLDLDLEAKDGGQIINCTFNYGGLIRNNTITMGNGNDTVFGTLHDINLLALKTHPDDPLTGIMGNNFNLGGNIITAGNGTDIVYGTMHDLNISSINASDAPPNTEIGGTGGVFGQPYGNTFTFGDNSLTVGNGNHDTLFGTLHAVNILVEGGYSNVGSGNDGGFNIFHFGNNELKAGNGIGDVLYGTMESLNIDVLSGAAYGSYGGLGDNYNSLVCGNNTLIVGNGAGDQLFGSMGDMTLHTDGGHNPYSAIAGFFGSYNIFEFGDNTLIAGSGAGDQLFGNLRDLTLLAENISADPVGGFSYIGGEDGHNDFIFGNNSLVAGNGNGDILYGSMRDFYVTGLTGGSFGNPDYATYNLIQFGDNSLTAGSGKGDMLFGNLHNLVLTYDGMYSDVNVWGLSIAGFIFHFGNNVLNSGGGNDVLAGQLNDILIGAGSTPSLTLEDFNAKNTIIGGHNTFNLGAGQDTLVFDVGITVGGNVVNAWDVHKDVLVFNDAVDLFTLNSRATLASDGAGGTLVTFSTAAGDAHNTDGGTIDFKNVAFVSGEHLIDLVGGNAAHLIVHA
jgi:hypothetical protein